MSPETRHIVERIESAPLDTVPCENFYIEQILPPPFFEAMVAQLPPDECYHPIEYMAARRKDGGCTRILMDLSERKLAGLAEGIRPLWRDVAAILTAPELIEAILRKFRATIPEGIAVTPVPILYRDFGGYAIGTHTDIADKVATFQIYLPADESQAHLGTTFLAQEGKAFREVKTNRFAPNSAYGFARTSSSWHSVKRLKPTEKPRNSLALTIYKRGREYRSDG